MKNRIVSLISDPDSPRVRKIIILIGVFLSALLGNMAFASDYTIAYTDIRGIVAVNGVPTPGVKVEVLRCDSGDVIECPPATVYSAAEIEMCEIFYCYPNLQTNYALSFNNDPNGTYTQCMNDSPTIPDIWSSNYTPWAVALRFTYNGCTQYVSCEAVSNAYYASLSCWPPGRAVICVDLPCAPPCPDCVDPVLAQAIGMGPAVGCTVLQLGPSKVDITGPAGGILGDVCIAPKGRLSVTGSEYITGTVKLGTGATFSKSGSGSVGGVMANVDLTAEINAAYAAYANAINLPCTQGFSKLDGKSVTTITGGVGINVICVGDVSLAGKQIYLSGPVGAKFIVKVSGKFSLTGGGAGPQIRVTGGLQPKDVLYVLVGTGDQVAFSGGGGGEACCAAVVDGTLLAPYRKIALSPGMVNGQVISGKDISIVSGSSVRCPPCH